MFYSASTNGFYLPEIHGDRIPVDSVEVSLEAHAALMIGQSSGQQIGSDEDGRPVLIDPPEPLPKTLEQIHALRLAAYRSESDPLKIETEYDALTTGTELDYTRWRQAVESIKERYPLPAA